MTPRRYSGPKGRYTVEDTPLVEPRGDPVEDTPLVEPRGDPVGPQAQRLWRNGWTYYRGRTRGCYPLGYKR